MIWLTRVGGGKRGWCCRKSQFPTALQARPHVWCCVGCTHERACVQPYRRLMKTPQSDPRSHTHTRMRTATQQFVNLFYSFHSLRCLDYPVNHIVRVNKSGKSLSFKHVGLIRTREYACPPKGGIKNLTHWCSIFSVQSKACPPSKTTGLRHANER